jgi:hypothetical protein
MNAVEKIVPASVVSVIVFLMGCEPKYSRPGPERSLLVPAFAADLRFQGRPIEEFTSVEAVFSLNNGDTGEKGIRPEIEYHEGRYMIQELVPGNYVLFISINANPDNRGGYPGYPGDLFYRDSRLFIPADRGVQLSIDLQRVIHLTLPQDNSGVMEHWGERGPAMIAFAAPVEFAWDAVADGALYHFTIYRMQSEPFKYLDRDVEEGTTQATRVSLDLARSEENEFYLFRLYAMKGPFRIGELVTHGKRGYGTTFRFRVK